MASTPSSTATNSARSRGRATQKSVAESLVEEAFTPGVRPLSFQIINVVLGALIVCLVVAIYADPSNIHFYALGSLGFILMALVNYYSSVFIETSLEADAAEKQRRRALKAKKQEAADAAESAALTSSTTASSPENTKNN